MYPRKEAQPAAKVDNGRPESRNKGGPSPGSVEGGGGVEMAPCSAESEMDDSNCSVYTKDTNHTNAALQN